MFKFTATFDLYIVKYCEYARWNISGGTKKWNIVSTLGEIFLVQQKMKRIPLIEGFQNMWVICCKRMFQFIATFDLYIVKHYEYTRWNIFGGTKKNETNSPNRGFPKYVGDCCNGVFHNIKIHCNIWSIYSETSRVHNVQHSKWPNETLKHSLKKNHQNIVE